MTNIVMELVAQLGMLAGVGALISVVVNVGKAAGVVTDGTAGNWSLGLNVAALAVLAALRIFRPDLGPEAIGAADQVAATLAQVVTLALGLFLQLRGAQFGHTTLRGAPFIGKSFSR